MFTEQKEYILLVSEEDPLEYGRAVYIARALLNLHKDDFSYSSTRSVPLVVNNNLKKVEQLIISPNPAKNDISIRFVNSDLVKKIKIINLNNEIIYEKDGLNSAIYTIPVSSIAPSVYILEAVNKDGLVYRGKFLIIK